MTRLRSSPTGPLDFVVQEYLMPVLRLRAVAPLIASSLLSLSSAVFAAPFEATVLVTDNQAANPGQQTDPNLKNGWGLSFTSTGPFWTSANGTGTSTIYTVNPTTQVTTVSKVVISIPGAGSVTGQVSNANSGSFNGDRFLFVSEDGTVSGWRTTLGTTAEVLQSASASNVYKGAAISSINSTSYLYAANFRSGAIDVLNGSASAAALTGSFTDPNLAAGYAPFNVQNLGGKIYVAYAQQDSTRTNELAGAGLGVVDAFDLQGNFLSRVASGGTLDAPWGLALAPSSFGALAGSLLVGNFGDGRISAFDLASNSYLGQVQGADGSPLVIDGLWALTPGNGGSAGSSALLYYTAGPNAEAHGVLGVLTPVPEPTTAMLWLAGLGLLATRRPRSRDRQRT
jgi:uncharacterized protein (TIGR03118 family)